MVSKASVVALVGRTNVGKSSLFNAILGRRENIVAREAGTTRDAITVKASYDGKDFWLVDTAGMKAAEDEFEAGIQEQISEASQAADLIVVVVDAEIQPTDEDRRIAKLALRSQKPTILVVNKVDKLGAADTSPWLKLGIKQIVATSATQKTGLSELLEAVAAGIKPAVIKTSRQTLHLTLLGRPNVGKSSLFNSLGAKQQALVSPQAGTTRDVNRLSLNYHGRQIELADTAGIRRSGKIERGVEHFSLLRTLAAIEQSDICVLVMDINELNVKLDQKIAGLVKDAGKGLILAVSKWDSLDDKSTRQHIADNIAANFEFAPWAPLVFTSAVSGQNVTKLFELALEVDKNRSTKFQTSELNKWLAKATADHPPAGLRGAAPKLKYMAQENDIDFPSFKIFGSKARLVHWSYRRYLEKQFRAVWPLEGAPINFWFIEN